MAETEDLINRSRRAIGLYNDKKRAEEAKRIFDLLPQGDGSRLNADMVDGYHVEEIVERTRKSIVIKAGGSGGPIRYTDAEAVAAVEAEAGLNLSSFLDLSHSRGRSCLRCR